MLIPIKKVIVRDRIRKDFGDIGELARDIKDNGMINPVVVNKDYVLLAGERRLRACKQLGYEQVEVKMMDTRDAEHELNIEISENDVRKGFSKSERVDYMYRLMRIEKEKAAERQKAGVPVKSSEGGEAKDKTAEAFGIGRQTMEREMQIVENKDLLTPEDFADWDEGRLSTNKAYQRIRAELDKVKREKEMAEGFAKTVKEQSKREARQEVQAELESLRQTNRILKEQASQTATVLAPEDYQEVKNSLDKAEDTIEQRNAEIASLKQQLKEASNEGNADFSATLYEYAVDDMATFISRYSDLAELSGVIGAMKELMA